jgi:two-component system cell cycle sensor histidine kinase/response regulator CckA
MEPRKNHILVVDDEPAILRMATAVLSSTGFKAIVAEDGSDGLECFIKHQSEICLVLTDVVMPTCDGLYLVGRILELDPQTKVILMSGYSDAQLEVEARKKFPFIRKPFLTADLVQKVHSVLNSDVKSTGA